MPLVHVHETGRSLRLVLDDPRRQNALSAEMVAEIERVLENAPPRLAALVVEGAGGAFSAGADLKALSEALARPPAPGETDPLQALNAAGGRFFARFAALPFVTIAVVDGAAVGGGMGLAAAADVVVATASARFALTETSLGLPPAQIAPHLVARLGERVTKRLALTGARLDGREAAAVGLADFFCESEEGREAQVEALLEAIERCAPGANAETKRLFRACRGGPTEAYVETAAQSFAAALRGPEGREGLAAFVGKRAPSWGPSEMSARFSSVLVANRGEIACRILRAAREEGLRTIAVFSDADAAAPHVRLADRRVRVGSSAPAQSYLSIGALIDAAKATGAEAVHPGYGFLAENADFAEACASAGLVFVGPPPAAIRAMGDKSAAKAKMEAAGVPCAPGYHGDDQSVSRFAQEAGRIGYPVMVKATAGGGGRGMRIVREPEALAAAFAAARSEAENAFGDGRLLIERALLGARHVEVQVFGDEQGRIVHLGERDCSIQRRHQKVIEEAPSPAVSPELRAAMGAAAVKAAAAVGYVGAGTVEFLLDSPSTEGRTKGDPRFYFLEMNTRIQVEHPVTECVAGVDLVRLQFRVAQGERLPFAQDDVALRGHAIEARLYAEDPAADFLPSIGRLAAWRPANGEGVRIDAGVETGSAVTPFYDSMLAKIVASGASREEARLRLLRALEATFVAGVVTNRDFLARRAERPEFVEGARPPPSSARRPSSRGAEPNGDRARGARIRRARSAALADCGLARGACCGSRSTAWSAASRCGGRTRRRSSPTTARRSRSSASNSAKARRDTSSTASSPGRPSRATATTSGSTPRASAGATRTARTHPRGSRTRTRTAPCARR